MSARSQTERERKSAKEQKTQTGEISFGLRFCPFAVLRSIRGTSALAERRRFSDSAASAPSAPLRSIRGTSAVAELTLRGTSAVAAVRLVGASRVDLWRLE